MKTVTDTFMSGSPHQLSARVTLIRGTLKWIGDSLTRNLENINFLEKKLFTTR